MTDVTAQLQDLVERAEPAVLPTIIGALAAAHALAMARLLALSTPTKNAADASHKLTNATAEDIAAALNTPVSFVYELARQKRIPCERFGRYVRFDLAAVKAALAVEANSKSNRLGSGEKRSGGKGVSAPATTHQPQPNYPEALL